MSLVFCPVLNNNCFNLVSLIHDCSDKSSSSPALYSCLSYHYYICMATVCVCVWQPTAIILKSASKWSLLCSVPPPCCPFISPPTDRHSAAGRCCSAPNYQRHLCKKGKEGQEIEELVNIL